MITQARIDISLKQDCLTKPVVHYIRFFDKDTIKELNESLEKAIIQHQEVLPVVIDSYGGEVYSLLGVIDIFEQSPIPIATIIEGKGMSCGAIAGAMGTTGYRYIGKNSYIMLHHVSSTSFGIAPQIASDTDQTLRLDKQIYNTLDKKCNQSFLELLKQKEGGDLYLDPQMAMSLGLVDFIGVPRLLTTVSVRSQLII